MLMLRMFSGRELPFDFAASLHFGSIYGPAKLRGITVSFQDCAIASIALHRDCPVATRDATAFEAAGIAVINPFGGIGKSIGDIAIGLAKNLVGRSRTAP